MALQQKEIGWDQWFTITQTSDYRRASKILGRYKEKAAKQLQQDEMDKMKTADDYAQKQHDREMEKMRFDRETKYGVADREANSFIQAANINTGGKIKVQQIKEDEKIPQQIAKTQGEIQTKKAESDLKNQQSLPNDAAAMPSPQVQQPVAPGVQQQPIQQ
jgi:hypothetical protein